MVGYRNIPTTTIHSQRKKMAGVNLSRLRTFCIQPNQDWNYFKRSFGRTPERLVGTCTGFSEHCDAILSRNCKKPEVRSWTCTSSFPPPSPPPQHMLLESNSLLKQLQHLFCKRCFQRVAVFLNSFSPSVVTAMLRK